MAEFLPRRGKKRTLTFLKSYTFYLQSVLVKRERDVKAMAERESREPDLQTHCSSASSSLLTRSGLYRIGRYRWKWAEVTQFPTDSTFCDC